MTRSGRSRFGVKTGIAVAVLATSLGLLAAEAAVRLCRLAPDVRPITLSGIDTVYQRSDNPILGYELKPDYQNDHADLETAYPKTNAHGQRDIARNKQKPDGVRRIILLGDSIVEGLGIADLDDTINRQMERMYGRDRTQVLNFGVSGYCTLAEIELLRTKGLAFDPDVVVLVFTANDFNNFNPQVLPLAEQYAPPAAARWLFLRSDLFRWMALKLNLLHFADMADPLGRNVHAIGENNVVEGLEQFRDLADRHGFTPLIAIWPQFANRTISDAHYMPGGETSLIVERLADSQGIATMRLSALFEEHWRSAAPDSNPRLYYTRGDGMHPSPRGAQVAAAALKAYLDAPDRYALKPRRNVDPIAVAAARSLSDPAPNQAAIFSNVGNRLLEMDQPEQAQRYYRMALELSPDDALIHNNFGAALLAMDQVDRAKQQFEMAAQLNPRLAPAHANLGKIAFHEKRLDDAIASYRAALAIDPDDFEVQYAIGRALAATGELDQAMEHWRVACALNEHDPGPMTMLAWSLATHPDDAQRQPGQAIELATRAVQLTEGHDPMSLDALGAAFAADGQFTKATDAARAAIAVGRDSPMLQPMRRRLSMYQRGEAYVASP